MEGGAIPTPRVDLTGLSVKSSTSDRAEVNVQFEIKNPHHQQLDLVDIDFTFEDEESQQVAMKKVEYSSAIEGCSSKSMEVPLELEYREFSTLAPSSMRAELSFRQALSGAFKVSIEKVKHLINVLEQQKNTPELEQQQQQERVTGYVNGMHISSLSPTQVGFMIVLRVSNGNPIPVRLDKASFTLESSEPNPEVGEVAAGAQVLVQKVVEARQSIPGRSQKRVEIPLAVKFDEIQPGMLPEPGKPLGFKLKMDFWFVDSTHGAYKISQEKSGSFPLLAPAMMEIKEVSFERNADDEHPEAKMKVRLKNSVPVGFKLTRLDYVIHFADESQGGEVARAELSEMELEVSGESVFEIVVDPVVDSVFGSALWDVFSDKISSFKSKVSVQGNSTEFGIITM